MSSDLEKLIQQIEANGSTAAEVYPKQEQNPEAGEVDPAASAPPAASPQGVAGGESPEPNPVGTISGSSVSYRKRAAFAVFLVLLLLLFSSPWR